MSNQDKDQNKDRERNAGDRYPQRDERNDRSRNNDPGNTNQDRFDETDRNRSQNQLDEDERIRQTDRNQPQQNPNRDDRDLSQEERNKNQDKDQNRKVGGYDDQIRNHDENDRRQKENRDRQIESERERNEDDPDLADRRDSDGDIKRNKANRTDTINRDIRMDETEKTNPRDPKREKESFPRREQPTQDPSRIEPDPDPSRRERKDGHQPLGDGYFMNFNRFDSDQDRNKEENDPKRNPKKWEEDRSDQPRRQPDNIRGESNPNKGFFNIDLFKRQSQLDKEHDDRRMPDYPYFNPSAFSNSGFWERKF